MNKIRVVNNKIIPFISNDVIIDNNSITFKENGNYFIDYIDSNNININRATARNIVLAFNPEYNEIKSPIFLGVQLFKT